MTEKDKDAAELEKGVRKEGGENAEVRVERDRVTEEAQSSEAHSGRLSGKGVEGGGRGEGEGRQQDDVVEKESASERGETSGGSGKSQDTPDLETLQQVHVHVRMYRYVNIHVHVHGLVLLHLVVYTHV